MDINAQYHDSRIGIVGELRFVVFTNGEYLRWLRWKYLRYRKRRIAHGSFAQYFNRHNFRNANTNCFSANHHFSHGLFDSFSHNFDFLNRY